MKPILYAITGAIAVLLTLSPAIASHVVCDKWGQCWNEPGPGECVPRSTKTIYPNWRYPTYRHDYDRNRMDNWARQPSDHDYDDED